MGRGRAKAKQTKVARRLKYYSPDTDLSALERELGAPHEQFGTVSASVDDSSDDEDESDADDDDGADDSGNPVDELDDDYEAWVSGGR